MRLGWHPSFRMASLLVMGGSNFRGNFSMYQLHPRRFTPDPPPGPVHGAPTGTAPVSREVQASNLSNPNIPSINSTHVASNVRQSAAVSTVGTRRLSPPENASGSRTYIKESMRGYRQNATRSREDERDNQVPWSSGILRDVSNQMNYHGNGTPLHLKESTYCCQNGATEAAADQRDNQVPWSSSILRDVSNQVNHQGNGTPLYLKESTYGYRSGAAAFPADHGDYQVNYHGNGTTPSCHLHQPETWGLTHLSLSGVNHHHDYVAYPETPFPSSGTKEIRSRKTDSSGYVVSHRNEHAVRLRTSPTSVSNGCIRSSSWSNTRSHRGASDQYKTKVHAISGRWKKPSSSSKSYFERGTIQYPQPSSDSRRSTGLRNPSNGGPSGVRHCVSDGDGFCSSDARRVTGFEPSALQGGELATSMPDLRRETVVLSHNLPAKVSGTFVPFCLHGFGVLPLCYIVTRNCLCLFLSLSLPPSVR